MRRPHIVSLKAICGDNPTFVKDTIIARSYPKEIIARMTINSASGDTDVMFHASDADTDSVLITSNINDAIEYYNRN